MKKARTTAWLRATPTDLTRNRMIILIAADATFGCTKSVSLLDGYLPWMGPISQDIGHLKLTEVAIGLLFSMCCVYGCLCARYGEDGDNYAESSDDEETFEHE